ncbi:MAG: UDP-N-acetylglucosamine--N-acetylmuramyl-(pentapeptide) pyrophosphoryl-undecaprenol N-acetylglucosamine transferase [Phycisphaerae bacterium]|nr:UDP-N-acetylglucosamine--N-acetylmuramyl-(pentapeptide) pyrophosphoryl-undecaprenol N-acetylglucosamine transferase [Phycisphaerae bacterium]
MPTDIYILAGGGTGGHLYPGLAVAGELLALRPAAKVVFACSGRAIDRRILEAQPFPFVPQPVRPLPARPWGWPRFLIAWGRSVILARRLILDLQPAAVLGLGGFAAGPGVCCAARAHVPTALLNPDAVPGKANWMLATRAEVIFTQFPSSREAFADRLRERVRCVGCPVRRGLTGADRAEAVAHFGLRPDRRTLLIFGGSLLAEALGEAVERLATRLSEFAANWQLLHLTGSPRAEQIQRALEDKGLAVRTQGYCDRMDLAYAAADLALARAGAVTIAELAATGTPAVLMPYPHHADRHQYHNAAALADSGAAVVCEDRQDAAANAAALRGVLVPLLRDAAALEAMTRAAAGLAARPSAAAAVAEWLVTAGGRG